MRSLLVLGAGLVVLGLASQASAAGRPGSRHVERDGVSLRVTPRTPDQIIAFYSARGFPTAAVRRLARSACFLGIGVRNRRSDIVWLEPARWRLRQGGRALRRLDLGHWHRLWREIHLPPANQATFGWTQLPESRNLQPGENVGGNITMVPARGRFSLEARFALGEARDHGELVLRVDDLSCPDRGATGSR
jgi:hypothetical protein